MFFLSCLLWNCSDMVWGKERAGVSNESTKKHLQKRMKFYASKEEDKREKRQRLPPLAPTSAVRDVWSEWMLFNIYSAVRERRESPLVLCSVSLSLLARGEMWSSLCLLKCRDCVWKATRPWRVLTQCKLKSLLQKVLPVVWHRDGLCVQWLTFWFHLECSFVSRSFDSCSEGLGLAVHIFVFRTCWLCSPSNTAQIKAVTCGTLGKDQKNPHTFLTGTCPIVILPLENTSSETYAVDAEETAQLDSNGERLDLFNSILSHLQKKKLYLFPLLPFDFRWLME